MNADTTQFEKYWRNVIANEIDTYNDDSVQIRQRLLGSLTCSAPVANSVIQLA